MPGTIWIISKLLSVFNIWILFIILSSKLFVIFIYLHISSKTHKILKTKKPKRNQNSIKSIQRYKILIKVLNFETNINFQGYRDWGSFTSFHWLRHFQIHLASPIKDAFKIGWPCLVRVCKITGLWVYGMIFVEFNTWHWIFIFMIPSSRGPLSLSHWGSDQIYLVLSLEHHVWICWLTFCPLFLNKNDSHAQGVGKQRVTNRLGSAFGFTPHLASLWILEVHLHPSRCTMNLFWFLLLTTGYALN